ncbi:hypothetical protein [Streptomyces nodosus]|uniref:hypothetical protein n=1 Tax=Streptomyces nodosus TaxID=40318 RepID=UPI003803B44A
MSNRTAGSWYPPARPGPRGYGGRLGRRPPRHVTGGLACVASVGLDGAVLPQLLADDAHTDEDTRRRDGRSAASGT